MALFSSDLITNTREHLKYKLNLHNLAKMSHFFIFYNRNNNSVEPCFTIRFDIFTHTQNQGRHGLDKTFLTGNRFHIISKILWSTYIKITFLIIYLNFNLTSNQHKHIYVNINQVNKSNANPLMFSPPNLSWELKYLFTLISVFLFNKLFVLICKSKVITAHNIM